MRPLALHLNRGPARHTRVHDILTKTLQEAALSRRQEALGPAELLLFKTPHHIPNRPTRQA